MACMLPSKETKGHNLSIFSLTVFSLILYVPELFHIALGYNKVYLSIFGYLTIIFYGLTSTLIKRNKLLIIYLITRIVLPSLILVTTGTLLAVIVNPNLEFTRLILSIAALILMELSAIYLYVYISLLHPKARSKTFLAFGYMFLLVGFLTYFIAIDFNLITSTSKHMLVFSEPSHYAFMGSSLIFFLLLSSRKYALLCLAISFVILSYLWGNVTIMVVTMMSIVFRFYIRNSLTTVLIILATFLCLILLFVNGAFDIENEQIIKAQYKLFTLLYTPLEKIRELTTLVYIQGWEYIFSSIKNYMFVGIGFQQMGSVRLDSVAQNILSNMNNPLNRTDGGFALSKIVVEFGFLSLFFIGFYLKKLTMVNKFIINKGRLIRERKIYLNDFLFYSSAIVSFLIPLFFRSTNYFNFSFFILIMGLCYSLDKLINKVNLTKVV